MIRANGFTLVELLAALVAGSFVLAGLSWAVASLGREVRLSAADKANDRLAAAAPVLVRLIEGAMPSRPGERQLAKPDRLELLTQPPQALGHAGSVRAILSVARGPQGSQLRLVFGVESPGSLPSAVFGDAVLLDGFSRIELHYFGLDPQAEFPPRLVTVAATGSDGQTRRISASPQINSRGGCRFDPISMTCRH